MRAVPWHDRRNADRAPGEERTSAASERSASDGGEVVEDTEADPTATPNARRSSLAILIAVAQGIGAVGGLALATKSLGTVEFGKLALAVVGSIVVRSIVALGLYGGVSVAYFNREGGRQEARNLIRWQARWAMPAATATLVAALVLGGVPSLVLATLSLGLSMSTALNQQNLFWAQNWVLGFTLAALGPTAIAHSLGMVASATIDGTARVYVLAMATCSLVCVLWLLRAVPRHGVLGHDRLAAALELGRPLVATALATAALAMLDRPLVRLLAGAEEVGQYFLTYVLAAGVIPLVGGFANSWLPEVLAHQPEERRAALVAGSRVYLPGFVLVSISLGLATPAVVSIVAGESYIYDLIGLTAGLIAVAAAPFVMYNAAGIELVGTERTKPVMRATLIGAIAALAVNIALLPTIGVVGAALATVVGYGVTSWVALRAANIKLSEIVAVATIVLVSIGLVLAAVTPVDGWWVVGRLAMALPFGLIGAALVFHVISPSGLRRRSETT